MLPQHGLPAPCQPNCKRCCLGNDWHLSSVVRCDCHHQSAHKGISGPDPLQPAVTVNPEWHLTLEQLLADGVHVEALRSAELHVHVFCTAAQEERPAPHLVQHCLVCAQQKGQACHKPSLEAGHASTSMAQPLQALLRGVSGSEALLRPLAHEDVCEHLKPWQNGADAANTGSSDQAGHLLSPGQQHSDKLAQEQADSEPKAGGQLIGVSSQQPADTGWNHQQPDCRACCGPCATGSCPHRQNGSPQAAAVPAAGFWLVTCQTLHLGQLQLIGADLKELNTWLPPNTVVLQLSDGLYAQPATLPDRALPPVTQPPSQGPSTPDRGLRPEADTPEMTAKEVTLLALLMLPVAVLALNHPDSGRAGMCCHCLPTSIRW